MALQITNAGVSPEWNNKDLALRAKGTDQYGAIYGGTMGVFDFGLPTVRDSMVVGSETPNQRVGGLPAVCSNANGDGSPMITDVLANGGVRSDVTSFERISLPNSGERSFDLNSLTGEEPSALIWLWVTHDASQTYTGANAGIAGHCYQTGAQMQWAFAMYNGTLVRHWGGGGGNGGYIEYAATLGEPVLLATLLKRSSDGVCTQQVYENDVLKGSRSFNYPFNAPVDGDAAPQLGYFGGGFNGSWGGVIHRVGGMQIDPDIFDMDAWLAAEIAANGGRW